MPNNIIDKIQISGQSYNVKDSSAATVVELTQQEYDNLPSSAKTGNTLFVITDAQAGDLTNYYTKSETNTLLGGKANTATTYTKTEVDTALGGKQATLVSGTNIKSINNESLLGSGNINIQGGGKAIEAGRGIAITTGETADTVSFNLPISAGTGTNSITEGYQTSATSQYSHAEGRVTTASGDCSHAEGNRTKANGFYSHAEGHTTQALGANSHSEGNHTKASSIYSHAEGFFTQTNNQSEHASGQYNVSSSASTTFGDSGNTLFSVGNGTYDESTETEIRHNAFEIRQNGDIYLTLDGQDVKLQDQLGGGGSSYTAGDGIDITNDVISVTGKADTSAVTAIQDSLSGYVTTDTEQIISGRKIFTYASSSGKAIEFKQTIDIAKVGFSIKNSASTNNEVASFEFRPNTFTIDGVQHPLLYFGHYRNKNTANAGVPQTVIGFRQYDQLNAAAYHYLLPLPEKAKTPFNLTTSFKDYYAPMGFKNGSTMITADNTGVVDISSELGGLKLVKLTQAQYDALASKDSNTLYIISD